MKIVETREEAKARREEAARPLYGCGRITDMEAYVMGAEYESTIAKRQALEDALAALEDNLFDPIGDIRRLIEELK